MPQAWQDHARHFWVVRRQNQANQVVVEGHATCLFYWFVRETWHHFSYSGSKSTHQQCVDKLLQASWSQWWFLPSVSYVADEAPANSAFMLQNWTVAPSRCKDHWVTRVGQEPPKDMKQVSFRRKSSCISRFWRPVFSACACTECQPPSHSKCL